MSSTSSFAPFLPTVVRGQPGHPLPVELIEDHQGLVHAAQGRPADVPNLEKGVEVANEGGGLFTLGDDQYARRKLVPFASTTPFEQRQSERKQGRAQAFVQALHRTRVYPSDSKIGAAKDPFGASQPRSDRRSPAPGTRACRFGTKRSADPI